MFTAGEKLRILEEAEGCSEPGEIICYGAEHGLPDAYEVHMAGKDADAQAVTDQVLEFDLPGRAGWEYEE